MKKRESVNMIQSPIGLYYEQLCNKFEVYVMGKFLEKV